MVSYRRIYYNTIKKWAEKIGAVAVPTIVLAFLFLAQRGDITITGYSGDMTCAGTELDPCYAYINFTSNVDNYFYPNTSWMFSTTPPIKKVILQRRWGNSWRTINLSKTWNSKVKYAVKFSKGKNYSIRFVGYKYNPYQDIKWGFANIDPIWYGVGVENQYKNAKVTYSSLNYENPDGSRMLILYSGARYGFENGHWKPIEHLKSFKGTTNIKCVVNYDGINKVECLDWNYTHVKLKVEGKGRIPLSIFENGKPKYSKNIDFSLKKQKEITVRANMGDVIHFGKHSTTITLQDPDTENLGDAYVNSSAGSTNYGSSSSLWIKGNNPTLYSYIKFNLSSIPSGANILDAKLALYCTEESGVDEARCAEYNNVWTEETITWDNAADWGDVIQYDVNPAQDTWTVWNVASWVKNQFDSGEGNVSFAVSVRSGTTGAYASFSSKESASNKPYLNISYAFPPTISNVSLNVTNINQGESVRLNATIVPYTGETIDSVISTWQYPNGTQVNKTMELLWFTGLEDNSGDLETGEIQKIAESTPSSCTNNGACSDLGDSGSCNNCPGCSWSSCPFIFSYNGSQYVLEGEGFSSGAFDFPLVNTKHTLKNAMCINGKRKIRITEHLNEESTTQELKLYEVKTSGTAIMDYNNKIHAYEDLLSPTSCLVNGIGCLNEVSKADKIYLKPEYKRGRLKDEILLTFDNFNKKDKMTLIFKGGKTEIVHNYYHLAMAMMRSKSLVEMISQTGIYQNIIRDFMERISPNIYVYNNGKWIKQVSMIGYYAIYTDSKEAVEINTYGEETVKVKIVFPNGFFRFDEIKAIKTEIPFSVKTVIPDSIKFNENYIDTYKVKLHQGDHLYLEFPCENNTVPILEIGGKYITYEGGLHLYKPPNIIKSTIKLYRLFVSNNYLKEIDDTTAEYKLYEWKSCRFPIKRNYIDIGIIPLVEATCSGTLNCHTYDSDQTNCEACSVCSWTPESYDTEANKSYTTYNNIDSSTWDNVTKINVTVYVSAYDNSGSTQNSNNNPDLYLEIYNGSDWVGIGAFNVDGTGNFSISTTQDLNWETVENRDIRIKGIYFDYNDSSHRDEINWTSVWVDVSYNDQPDNWYTYVWTDTSTSGTYNVTDIYANDTSGNMNHTTYTNLYFEVASSGAPDTDFKVYNGSSWSYDFTNNPIFICGKNNPPAPGESCTDSNVAPEYQSSSQAIFNLTNNGTVSGTGKLKLTGLFTNITIFCDNDNDYTGATTLSTTYQDICGNINAGSSCTIWCWANFTTFNPPAESYTFNGIVE